MPSTHFFSFVSHGPPPAGITWDAGVTWDAGFFWS